MARFVVLSFDDNAEAEDFVNSFREDGGVFFKRTRTERAPYSFKDSELVTAHPYENFTGRGQILALFFKPTVFCDCFAKGNYDKKEGYTRGKKYGLFIHKCGKPGRLGWENPLHKLTGFGYNLLSKKPHEDTATNTQEHNELGFHPAVQTYKQ